MRLPVAVAADLSSASDPAVSCRHGTLDYSVVCHVFPGYRLHVSLMYEAWH